MYLYHHILRTLESSKLKMLKQFNVLPLFQLVDLQPCTYSKTFHFLLLLCWKPK